MKFVKLLLSKKSSNNIDMAQSAKLYDNLKQHNDIINKHNIKWKEII